jgi:hypothetical protein
VDHRRRGDRDAFFGLAVIADQNLIGAAWDHALGRTWGPSLQSGQVIGGGALRILGDHGGPASRRGASRRPGAKPWWEDGPRFTGRFKPA